MLVLDTDHVTEYQRGTSAEAHRLKQRLDLATEPYATTIVTAQEILRTEQTVYRSDTNIY
jgi:predicted nucleic acid-binding protein